LKYDYEIIKAGWFMEEYWKTKIKRKGNEENNRK